MLTAFRWLMRIFTGLIALGLLAGGLVYYVLTRSLQGIGAVRARTRRRGVLHSAESD